MLAARAHPLTLDGVEKTGVSAFVSISSSVLQLQVSSAIIPFNQHYHYYSILSTRTHTHTTHAQLSLSFAAVVLGYCRSL